MALVEDALVEALILSQKAVVIVFVNMLNMNIGKTL